MPKLSWMTLAKGARQLVVQEALLQMQGQTRLSPLAHVGLRGLRSGNGRGHVCYLTMVMLEGSYLSSLTPMTNMGASGDGADTTTRLAPAWM